MTDIVIVGKAYYADRSPDQGLPPGSPGSPSHPWVPPPPGYWGGVAPPHPDQGLPGVPPGFWGGVAPPHPDQGLPGTPPGYWGGVAPPYPDQGLPAGQIGTPVPPDLMPPPAVPEEIASQYIVSVYNPKTMEWTTKSYPPPAR